MIENCPLLIYRPCPICFAKEYRKVFEVAADVFFATRFGINVATIVQCESCRMRYVNPVLKPKIDALQYIESEGYNQPVKSSLEVPIWEDQIICFKEICAHAFRKNTRLLDVGCGEGGLVDLLQMHEFDAHGIELNKNAVLRSKQRGTLNITLKRLEDIEGDSFDILTAIHVLEHLQNCREFAFQASRILKSNGMVLVAVPNYFSFQYRLKEKTYWNAPFQHMNGLTAWSLDRLFLDFGFQRIPMKASFSKRVGGVNFKSRVSLIITKALSNNLNLFPTKLICIYRLL